MKFLNFIGILFFLMPLSCQKNQFPPQPEILTAEYEMVTQGEFERGYKVYVKLKYNEKFKQVYYLNLNGFMLKNPDVVDGDWIVEISGYFPIQSKVIQNFEPPERTSMSNGIVFGDSENSYFYQAKFKLKKK